MPTRDGYSEVDPVFCFNCQCEIRLNHKYRIVKHAARVKATGEPIVKYLCEHVDCDNPSVGTHNVTGEQFERKDGHKYKFVVPLHEQGKQIAMEPIDPNELLKK